MNKKTLFSLLVMAVFATPAAYAQGRGGGAAGGSGAARGGGAAGGGLAGAPVGGPTPSNRQQGSRPSGIGKPESPSSKASDHRAEAASLHAADPKDTHGFKNYGQYVAANHISEHLGIPLTDLKAAIDAEGGNLGKAIRTLHPELTADEVKAEVKRAEATAKKAQADAKRAQGEAKKAEAAAKKKTT